MVAALPAGLDTVVGDRGGRLSGGERQRIGLARALVRSRAAGRAGWAYTVHRAMLAALVVAFTVAAAAVRTGNALRALRDADVHCYDFTARRCSGPAPGDDQSFLQAGASVAPWPPDATC